MLEHVPGLAKFLSIVAAFATRFRRQGQPLPVSVPSQRLLELSRPLDFELIPISFEIATDQRPPRIQVCFRAVNYLRKKLRFSAVMVDRLSLPDGPYLSAIPGTHLVEIPVRRSMLVYCERAISDTEVSALQATHPLHLLSGALTVSALGFAGRNAVAGTFGSMAILGRLLRTNVAQTRT
ncbi:MAG TPA: hypothetical protein VMM18_17240 [Gemmatimonadaceae bacterium]|nr:hypothetical protein [Gemmatimonadaceae bacterium]